MAIKKLQIAFDIDQVVIDFLGHFIRFYNLKYDKRVTPQDITTFLPSGDLNDIINAEEWQQAFEYFESNGGYASCPSLEGARTSIENILKMGHKINFITSRSSHFRGETEMSFILNKIPFDKKSLYFAPRGKYPVLKRLKPDVFVDDSAKNCEDALKAGIEHIYLIDMPYNREETRFKRISNIMQLERILTTDLGND